MHSRSHLALFLTTLSLASIAVSFAFAEPIRYEFSGRVVTAQDLAGSPIRLGDPFQGTFFFDPDQVSVRYVIDGYKFYDPLFGSAGLEINVSTTNGILTFANVPGYLGIEMLDHFTYSGLPPFYDRFLIYCTEFTRFPTAYRRRFVYFFLDVASSQESFVESTDLPRHLSLPGQGYAVVVASGGATIVGYDYYLAFVVDHLALANQPPDCSAAVGSIPAFVALDGGFAPVTITGVTDPDGDPVTIAVTGVSQDEPVSDAGARPTCPDAIVDAGSAQVRRERSGTGNGRVYRVAFTASDGRGGSCDGAVSVCVPHDQGTTTCVDDGTVHDSMQPCAAAPSLSAAAGGVVELAVAPSHGRGLAFDFTLPEAGNVSLTVHDVAGRVIATIARGPFGAGAHRLEWRADGQRPGIYFARLRTESTSVVKRFAVL